MLTDPRHWLPEEVCLWLTDGLQITSSPLVDLFRGVSGAKLYANRRKADWFLGELGVKELLTRCRIAAAIQKLFADESSDDDPVLEDVKREESNSDDSSRARITTPLQCPDRRGLLALPAAKAPQIAVSRTATAVSTLEINPTRPSGEPSIMIPACLAAVIKPHQLTGIRFLWRTVVQEGRGAILAHAMGLGKTLQTIAFVHTLLCEVAREARAGQLPATYSSRLDYMPKVLCYQRPLKILVLCPPIVISNWHAEYDMWIPEDIRRSSRLHSIHRLRPQSSWPQKLEALRLWHEQGGIFVLGYQMYRQMLVHGPKVLSASQLSLLRGMLVAPGPSVLIADEGHIIKNVNGTLAAVIKQTATPLRICLTGYPLQNNLVEYWCMVDFVRPAFLDDLHRFRSDYVHPINRGSTVEASRGERKLAARRLFVLTRLLDPFVSRMDQGVLLDSLPHSITKHEYVLSCRLSPLQRRLYDAFLDKRGRVFYEALFTKTVMLMRILNHPAILRIAANSASPTGWSKEDDDYVFAFDDDDHHRGRTREDASRIMNLKDWASAEMHLPDLMHLRHSPKMRLAIQLLRAFKRVGDKCLLFSRSIPTLDYICDAIDELNRHGRNNSSKKQQYPPIAYFRMDGTTHSAARLDMIARFNADQQDNVDVFLISTMTGSLGINLTRANRVILLDVGWNPCHDEQAIGRAFRFGQRQSVYVYRLQCYGTIDERLYRLNVHKVGMAKRVIDKQNIEKHFTHQQMTHYFATPSMPEEDPEVEPLAMQIDGTSTGDVVLDRLLLESCTGTLDGLDDDEEEEDVGGNGRNVLGVARWFHHHSLLEESLVDELTTAELKEAAEELERERLRLSSLPTGTARNGAAGKLGLLSGLRTAYPSGYWEDTASEPEQDDGDEEDVDAYDDEEEEERFYLTHSAAAHYHHKRPKQHANNSPAATLLTLPPPSSSVFVGSSFTTFGTNRDAVSIKDGSHAATAAGVASQGSKAVARHSVDHVPSAITLPSPRLSTTHSDKVDLLDGEPERTLRMMASAKRKPGATRGQSSEGVTKKLSIIDLLLRTPPRPANLHPAMPVVSPVRPVRFTTTTTVEGNDNRRNVGDANSSAGAQSLVKEGRNVEAPPHPRVTDYSRPVDSATVVTISSSDSEDCLLLAAAVRS